jgi:lambda repressor-like predicted transcriptional regulator
MSESQIAARIVSVKPRRIWPARMRAPASLPT